MPIIFDVSTLSDVSCNIRLFKTDISLFSHPEPCGVVVYIAINPSKTLTTSLMSMETFHWWFPLLVEIYWPMLGNKQDVVGEVCSVEV